MPNGESYRHTQMGWPMLVILPIVIAVPAVLLAGSGAWLAIGFLALIAIAIAAIFAALTVTVDETHVRLRFGVGLIKKAFPLADIRDCRIVRNPWYYGTGIRMLGDGWLYNVSGTMAVELEMPGASRARIGTDEPERLLAAIREARPELAAAKAGEAVPERRFPWQVAFVLPIVAIVPVLLYMQTRPPTVDVSAGRLSVSSVFYSSTISLSDITEVVVADSLPAIAARTNGFAMGGALRGRFRLKAFGSGSLYVNRKHPPFVMVRTKDSFVIVGFDDPARTQRLVADLARAGRS